METLSPGHFQFQNLKIKIEPFKIIPPIMGKVVSTYKDIKDKNIGVKMEKEKRIPMLVKDTGRIQKE